MSNGKNSFFSYLLTLIFTALSLIIFGSLAPSLYSDFTSEKTYTVEKLISFFGKNLFFLLQLVPFVVALTVLLFCVRFVHGIKIKSLFTQKDSFSFKKFFIGFISWGILLCLVLISQIYLFKKPIYWNFDYQNFIILALISFVFVSFQTLFEEVLFRSYLLQSFSLYFSKKWMAIALSSMLFALLHFSNPEVKIFGSALLLYYFISGLFLSLITFLDRGIELAFGFHLVNNLFGTLILTNNWQVFQTDALFKDFSPAKISWEIWITALVLYPLLFLFFKKVYKWKIGEIFA